MIRLEAARVTHHVEVGGRDGALTHGLAHQVEVVPGREGRGGKEEGRRGGGGRRREGGGREREGGEGRGGGEGREEEKGRERRGGRGGGEGRRGS